MTLMSEHDSQLTFPDTRAGRALAGYLAAFNSAGPVALLAWSRANYALEALQETAADDRAAVHALTQHTARGLEPVAIEQSEEDAISVLGRTRLTGDWARATVQTSPDGVLIARIRPASAPRDERGPRGSDAEFADELTAYVERLVEADVFSGALLLARHGEPFCARAWGLASLRYGVPNRIDTKFNLGSMNKMFTAVSIAQLVERGTLAFESTVAELFPDYPGPGADQISVHHLLTHTSGLGDYFNERFAARKAELRSVDDFLPLFQDAPLLFTPGERFAYSNAGMLLLGALLERVTGQDYFDYVREHVYAVAGMPDTDAYEMDRPVPNLAIGYTLMDGRGRFVGGARRSNLFMHVIKGGPAGGGFSTVHDLLAFDCALRGHQLLSPALAETVLTGKVATGRGATDRYAYGFIEDIVNGERIVGHGGGVAGINAQLDMYLGSGYTVVVLSNYDPTIAQQIATKARELLT
jgi:CubicO group peptidase (beta-lactamase class C family)